MTDKCTEGLDECKFITKISYEISDNETGKVVDVTTYENLIPLTYLNALVAKYAHMERLYCGSTERFKDATNVMEALANWNAD